MAKNIATIADGMDGHPGKIDFRDALGVASHRTGKAPDASPTSLATTSIGAWHFVSRGWIPLSGGDESRAMLLFVFTCARWLVGQEAR